MARQGHPRRRHEEDDGRLAHGPEGESDALRRGADDLRQFRARGGYLLTRSRPARPRHPPTGDPPCSPRTRSACGSTATRWTPPSSTPPPSPTAKWWPCTAHRPTTPPASRETSSPYSSPCWACPAWA